MRLHTQIEYTFYIIKFPNNTCYIGRTKEHEYTRWGTHISDCRKSKHCNGYIQSVYNKYTTKIKTDNNGWVTQCGARDWKFEVLHREYTHDKKFIDEIEKRYIKKYLNEGKMGVLNIKGVEIDVHKLRTNKAFL